MYSKLSQMESKHQRTTVDLQKHNENSEPIYSSNLNVDCLALIFQYLQIYDRVKCERVCKLWNQASRASWYNFKKLDLVDKTWGSVKPISTYFSNLKHVISRCGGVITEIELIGHSRQPGLAENSESFVKILVMCPNLRRLDLGYLRVGINFVRDLTRHCKNLESLTLTRLTSRCNDTVLGDFLFDKLNLRCVRISLNKNCLKGFCLRKLNPEHIEEISITDSRKIDEKLLTDVMPNLKKLHTLNLRNSIYGGSQRSRNSNTTLLLRAICKLESLKVLDISCNYRFVDDVNIVELIPLRDQLTTLCIGNTSVTDVGLANMTSSSSLQSLSVQFLKITGSGFGCMPKLISLNCRFCQRLERNNLLKLLSGSENLNNLHLSHCPIVTKSFVEAVEAVTSCRENYATLTISLNKVKYDTLELSADYRDSLKFEII